MNEVSTFWHKDCYETSGSSVKNPAGKNSLSGREQQEEAPRLSAKSMGEVVGDGTG